MTMACHTRPVYALWVAIPEMAILSFQGWALARPVLYKRLSTLMDTPCHMGLLSKIIFLPLICTVVLLSFDAVLLKRC
jgi:hypothetical protein